MAIVFMTDPATGRCALYDENGTSGALDDPNSARNAPLNSPASHLSKVYFHSDFDYYQVHSITSVTINHAAVAGASVAVTANITRIGQMVKTTHTLVTHSLGYAPSYMIESGGTLIGQSSVIQIENGGRIVSPYATTSTISLLDAGSSTAVALSAMSKTYRVVIFRQPTADSAHLFDWDPTAGTLVMGKGKFRGALQALRRTLIGDASPFDIPLGRTSDIRNGFSRTVLADGSTFTYPPYTGSFSGSASIQCTVE
jgi:hypothetical protein